MAPKILIVDDHEVVREGVRTLITRERPQWEVCGEAKNGQEAVEASRNLKPDVTILDITMPKMSGLEVASTISELGSRVLMFTMHESEHLATEVSRAGAQGFVLKSQAGKDLIRAIERLLSGGTFFGSESNPQEDSPAGQPPSGRLAKGSPYGSATPLLFGVGTPLSWYRSY
ncbi:MAG TPA: response regulator transcription factor [Terriglobales bacterium]|jgi:DNA-binding NarL/FixJ family response regulator